ncbi:MAG: universal stress protein [Desulfobacterales bacterium]
MSDIKKIMVALDFTSYSQSTFDYAVKIARNLNAYLVVASIINSRDISAVEMVTSMGYEVDSEHYVEGIKTEREKMLTNFLKHSDIDREHLQMIFKVGNPTHELLKLIVAENVDMVVMGVKGRTDLEHIFIGSVAEKLFRRSPVPVLSHRDEKNAERLREKIEHR